MEEKRLFQAMHEAVKQVVEARMAEGLFPSAVVRVFDSNHTLMTAEFGGARAQSVFDVASLTKIATATQILLLISSGRLSLADKILSVLPSLNESRLLKSRLSEVDLYSLLTHTSGIVDWYPFYAHRDLPFEEVLAITLERYGRVEGMVYSDLNFMLLGKVLESVRRKPLDACLREDLVLPLKLGNMGYHPDPADDIIPSSYGNPIEEEMCAQRSIPFDGWRAHEPLIGGCNDGNAYYYFGGAAGSAGIFADALSYERLCRFYMTSDDPLMIRAQQNLEMGRGLGLETGVRYPQGCGHTGFTGTSIFFSKALNIGVVAFTNRLYLKDPLPEGMQAFRRELHEAVVRVLVS